MKPMRRIRTWATRPAAAATTIARAPMTRTRRSAGVAPPRMPACASVGPREGATGTAPAVPAAPTGPSAALTSRPRLVPPRGDVGSDRLDVEGRVAPRIHGRDVLGLAGDHLPVGIQELEGDLRGGHLGRVEVREEAGDRGVLIARLELAHRHFEWEEGIRQRDVVE